MSNALFILVTMAINIIHTLFYLRLKTRNPLRFISLFIFVPALWPVAVWLSTTAPYLMPVAMTGYVISAFWIFRMLITNDKYSRILLTGALVLSFTQVLRIPPLLIMVYAFGWPGPESLYKTTFIYPVVFALLSPLLFKYARKRVMRVLDIAETQKLYLVGLMPVLLMVLGLLNIYLVTSSPHTPGVLPVGILTPVCILAYFVSTFLFLVNYQDKQILKQQLAAAEQLEHTYEFYDRLLSEKESRLRTLRHDFRHLAVHLDSLADKGDLENLKQELGTFFRPEAPDLLITPFCENHTVNALVSYHFARAEKQKVNCVATAFVPAKLPFPDAELALLLGNALENCLKGAGPLGEMGYITFTAKPVKGALVMIFTNNYDKKTYAKGEGAGLASIRQLCDLHQARVEVADTGTEFTLRVFLPML